MVQVVVAMLALQQVTCMLLAQMSRLAVLMKAMRVKAKARVLHCVD